MKFILGEKSEMTQLFLDDGRAMAVTIVKAGPCQVVQVKKQAKDGYQAVQLGYGTNKKPNKAQAGRLKGLNNFRFFKEFRLKDEAQVERGQIINVSTFEPGNVVKVTGISKGKGFQGVVKRHGFHGSPASHGHKDQLRMPGSIGATDPQRVFKGTRMGGHMGDEQVSVKNLEVLKIDPEKNLLYLKGAVPGARGGLILIQSEGELKIVEETPVQEAVQPVTEVPEAVASEVKTEAEKPAETVVTENNNEQAKE